LGVGAFLGFGPTLPKLTIASYSPGDHEKNGFCLGEFGPHLGEISGFEIWHFLAFWRTLAYFCSELCRQIFDFLTALDSHMGRLTIVEILRKFISWNSRNVGRNLGGGALLVHFWGLPPFGARIPHLTHASYSSGDPEKIAFCLGKSAPIWGRYGGLKFGFLAYFGLLVLGTLSTDFRFFEYVRQPHGLSSDPENFVNIKFVEFE